MELVETKRDVNISILREPVKPLVSSDPVRRKACVNIAILERFAFVYRALVIVLQETGVVTDTPWSMLIRISHRVNTGTIRAISIPIVVF